MSAQRLGLDGHYASLNGLSYGIGYLEQLLAILSEPLLIAATVVAFIDFQTHGGLLALPVVVYAWATVMGVSVTACFIVTWRKALRAFSLNRYVVGGWLVLLMLCLGFADWAAVDVQSLQQALGIPFGEALSRLNLNIVFITHIRAAVTVAMSAVVALSNHTLVTTAKAPARRITVFDRLLDRVAPIASPADLLEKTNEPTEETAQPAQEDRVIPAQNGAQHDAQPAQESRATDANITAFRPRRTAHKTMRTLPQKTAHSAAQKKREKVRSQVRDIWEANRAMSARSIARQVRRPEATVRNWIKEFKGELAQEQAVNA